MNRTFLVFIVTQIFSLIGSRMTGIAIGIRVFEETGDTSPILIAAFFAELPLMVAGSFTGILADKWDRRWVIALGDVGQAVGTLILLLSFTSGSFELWHLYAVMFVQGVFGAIQSPASEAAITVLIPENQRDRANGIRQIGFPLAGVVAPVIAGFVYAVAGLEAVISIDFITFVVAVVVVLNLHFPKIADETGDDTPSFWREMLGGWSYLLRQKALLWVVVYLAFINFLINGPLEMAVPYMLSRTNDEAVLGILLGAFSGGAFAGGIVVALIGNVRHRIHVMLAGYVLHGMCMIAYGMAQEPLLLGLSVFWALFPLSFNGALFDTFLQNTTPPALQGRVFAITGQIFTLTTPFSFLITAYLVDHVLEPAVGTTNWSTVAPIVGDTTGAGMGLILVCVGVVIVLSTFAIWTISAVRTLENDMPVHAVEATI
ncbi:MAG: MFS transporter [Aggregatilineales bacterium]